MDGIIRNRRQYKLRLQVAVGLVVIIASFLALYGSLYSPVSAVTPPDNCFVFSAGTITGYHDYEANDPLNPACPKAVDIPATIGGAAVTAIGVSAFQGKQLTAVTVPYGVTTIGGSAFRENVIESVTLPDSVTSIGTWAFYINKLTETDIPDNLTGLSSHVFRSNKLTDVVLPAGITTIGSYAFENNPISSINIPHGVTSIGGLAFSGGNLTEIEFPDTLTFIGERSFRYNDFTTVTIPASVNHMDWGVFYGNYSLKEAIFEGDVADLANDTFQLSNSLETVSYNGVRYPAEGEVLANEACYRFDAGTGTVTGVDRLNLNIIKDQATSCLALDLAIPDTIGGVTVTAISSNAFYGRQLTSVDLPDSLLEIYSYAFYGNQLKTIDIPDSVMTIGSYAFGANQLTSYVWPVGLASMPDYVFYQNYLSAVEIPEQITSIGAGAFWVNKISSLQLHGDINFMGNSAFRDNELTELAVPEGITTIGMLVFADNYLEEVSLPSTLETIGVGAFQLNSIAEIELPSSVSLVEDSAFSHQSPYGRNILDDIWSAADAPAVREILDSIFYTRVMLEDPANPHNLKSEVNYRLDSPDYDRDGDLDESINFGGYIINPAALQLNYRNDSNQNIQNRMLFAGMLSGGGYIHSYRVSEGPAVPAPVDRLNPTALELEAMELALTAYYRLGETVTITPLAIAGYATPPAQTFTLASALNDEVLVYADESTAGGGSGGVADNELADTGTNTILVLALAVGLVGSGVFIVFRHKLASRGVK